MEYSVSFKTAGRGAPKYVHFKLAGITIQNQSHEVQSYVQYATVSVSILKVCIFAYVRTYR